MLLISSSAELGPVEQGGMSSVGRASWAVRLTWLSHLEWGSQYHRTRPEGRSQPRVGREEDTFAHSVYMLYICFWQWNVFLETSSSFINVSPRSVCERDRDMSESQRQQLSPAFQYVYKAQNMLGIQRQKGWKCGFVGISKCKTGLSSPLFGCHCFPTEWKCLHPRHVARNMLGKAFQFLCIENKCFFQWVLFCVHSLIPVVTTATVSPVLWMR